MNTDWSQFQVEIAPAPAVDWSQFQPAQDDAGPPAASFQGVQNGSGTAAQEPAPSQPPPLSQFALTPFTANLASTVNGLFGAADTADNIQPQDVATGAGHGLERVGLNTGRGLAMAAGGLAGAAFTNMDSSDNALQQAAFDAAAKIKQWEEEVPTDANAGQKLGALGGNLAGGIATLGVGEAGSKGQDVIDAGGTVNQGYAGAALGAAQAESGLAIGHIGGNLPARLLGQGAASGASGEATRLIGNQVLPDSMHRDFSTADLALNVGIGMGGALFAGHEAAALEGAHGPDVQGVAQADVILKGAESAPNVETLAKGVPDGGMAATKDISSADLPTPVSEAIPTPEAVARPLETIAPESKIEAPQQGIPDEAAKSDAGTTPAQDQTGQGGSERFGDVVPSAEPDVLGTRPSDGEGSARSGDLGRTKNPSVDFSESPDKTAAIGDTKIRYSSDGDSAHIMMVQTPPKARGQGSAREAMDTFTREADAQGKRLTLDVAPTDSRVDEARLTQFYRSHGFEDAGTSKNGDLHMVREAKSSVPESKFVETKNGAYLDTRGGSERFHGSSAPIEKLSDDYAMNGDSRNIYGQGFYTTDAADISHGYMKKGSGKEPTLHTVEHGDVPLYNMEMPLTTHMENTLRKTMGDNMPTENVETGQPLKNLREVFDEYRKESKYNEMSRDDVQEVFDSIRYNLAEEGFRGYEHIGGGATGHKPHNVKIFWAPENDVRVSRSSIDKYIKPEPKPEPTPKIETIPPRLRKEEPKTDSPARPESVTPERDTTEGLTGIKNAAVNESRFQRELEALPKAERVSHEQSMEKAVEKIHADPEYAHSLERDIISRPRSVTDVEHAAMLHNRRTLETSHAQAADEVARAVDANDHAAMIQGREKLRGIEERLDQNDQAARLAGTHTARGLAFRRAMLAEDFSFARIKTITKARKGSELTEQQTKALEASTARVKQLETELQQARDGNVVKMRKVDPAQKKSAGKDFSSLVDRLKKLPPERQLKKGHCAI